MATMLVTGGAGFIGCNFVRHVLETTDDNVVVYDNLTYAGNRASLADVEDDERYTFIKADIADRAAVEQAIAEHRPESIVNFAAESHVDRSIDSPRPFVQTNIVGTFELLEAGRRYVAELPADAAARFRFLHVSTDEVFGSLGPDGLFSEESHYAPNSPYAASKASADHIARAYQKTYGLPVLLTNCANNYGPYQFPEKLIPLMALNALEGKPLPIYGDGGNIRDWLYVEDHCAGILLVLRSGVVGESYNIGGGNERTNLEVVEAICASLERLQPAAANRALAAKSITDYTKLKTFVEDRLGHDRRYAIDATKIRRELGWEPKHAFEAGIEATIAWYLANRVWCETVQAGGDYSRERLGLGKAPEGEDGR